MSIRQRAIDALRSLNYVVGQHTHKEAQDDGLFDDDWIGIVETANRIVKTVEPGGATYLAIGVATDGRVAALKFKFNEGDRLFVITVYEVGEI